MSAPPPVPAPQSPQSPTSPASGTSGTSTPPATSTTPDAAPRTDDTPPVRVLMSRIAALAGPTMLLSLLQGGAQLFETWLAARQGTAALAGWAVVLPFSLLLNQMSAGAMSGGVVSAISRALGAGREDEASALVMHAVAVATIAGLLFAIALAVFPMPLLGAIAGPEVAREAAWYSIVMFGVGAVPAWLTNTLASVLRGGGRHALAARVLVVTWVAIPLSAWLFAEPMGFGLVGIGIAFALVFWISAIVMALVVIRGGAGFVPTLRIVWSGALFRTILSVGLLACALATIANLTTIMVTAQLKSHGTAAVAAYGISARLEFLMIPLAFGVGSALTALVGRASGAGDWRTARRTAWTGGLAAFAFTGAIGAAVGLAPVAFASAFTHDAEVIAIAARALSWIGPAFGGFGLGMALYFASMGARRMRWPMLAGVARFTLAVGGGWLLADVAGMGLDGYFLAVALGITAYGAVTAAGVRAGVWNARGG